MKGDQMERNSPFNLTVGQITCIPKVSAHRDSLNRNADAGEPTILAEIL